MYKKYINLINIYILISFTPVFSKYIDNDLGIISHIVKYNNFVIIGYCYILLIHYLYKGINKKKHIEKSTILLLFFVVLISGISMITSLSKATAAYMLIKLYATIVFAYYLIDYYKYEELLSIILFSQLGISIIVFMFTNMFPNMAYDFYLDKMVLVGSFGQKNNLAAVMSYGCIIAFINLFFIKNNKLFKVIAKIIFISNIYALFRTGSVTSMITLGIALVMFFVIKKLNIKFNFIIPLLVLNIGIIPFALVDSKWKIILGQIINRDITFTGRTIIWQNVIEIIKMKPLLGYGYGTFWQFYPELAERAYAIGSHNGMLELILQIGIIGTILFIALLINLGKNIKFLCNKNDNEMIFPIMFLTYILVYFLTERSMIPLNYQTLNFIIVILIVENSYTEYMRMKVKRK